MLPLWLKIAYTLFTAVTVVAYARKYPPANFLWFSDLALLALVPAFWLESALLTSMAALAVLLPDVLWNVGFFGRLLTGKSLPVDLAGYMFDAGKPLWLRALSIFHVFFPPLLVFAVARLGYDSRALLWQTLAAWIVLPVTFRVAPPALNVNWTRGIAGKRPFGLSPRGWLVAELAAFPALVYAPTHLVLARLYAPS